MALEIQVGPPPVDGRYVVYTPCAALQVREWCEPSIASYVVYTPCAALQVREWCEPSIASFHDGRWHAYEPVWGWIGPLPVVHGNDCLKKLETASEYDL